MSHKSAKRIRSHLKRLASEGRGVPWVEDGNCLKGRPMCETCAFRKGSKEMVAYQHGVSHVGADDGPPVIAIVGRTISKMLRDGEPPQPFYCHYDHFGVEVPKDAEGTYLYIFGDDGQPKEVPVCAGWLAKVEGIKRVMEQDGDIKRRAAKPLLVRESK